MKFSNFIINTLKESPKEAQIISHKLMLRTSMVKQHTAGIYIWLPLGLRVLRKIEEIIRKNQNDINCQELLMPTIQSADLWKKSGRYDDYGKEMLRIRDRHEVELLYGPTNEEIITDFFMILFDLPKKLKNFPPNSFFLFVIWLRNIEQIIVKSLLRYWFLVRRLMEAKNKA